MKFWSIFSPGYLAFNSAATKITPALHQKELLKIKHILHGKLKYKNYNYLA
jgi:hypothetical protein